MESLHLSGTRERSRSDSKERQLGGNLASSALYTSRGRGRSTLDSAERFTVVVGGGTTASGEVDLQIGRASVLSKKSFAGVSPSPLTPSGVSSGVRRPLVSRGTGFTSGGKRLQVAESL